MSFPGVRSDRELSRLAQEVFALPAQLAELRKRKVVVALDEFQAIGGFDGGTVEHALRAAVQHQRDVGYVFAGSEPSLMERMLTPKRPFYKAGPVMRLAKIPAGVVNLRSPRVVYVSCDVPTLARDARVLMDAGYRVAEIVLFDLFPNTAHVESVTVFEAAG